MQQLVHEPDSRSPRRTGLGSTLRALSLWTALFGLGATVGCGTPPPVGPIDNAESVQNNLTPMCITETQGSTTSCKDEKTWSSYAAMACAGKGLMMTKISYATSCGTGLYRQTTYECCGSTTTPPPPMCMWVPGIGTAACESADEWKKQGTTYCATHGLTLSDLKFDHPCTTGGYASAQYECCTPTTTPPPPPTCSTESLASMTCVDDATWKSKAEAVCKAKMQTVGTIATGAACMGGHLDIKFQCCGTVTPPPPPPPPPPMCTTETLASMTCVDDATWKSRAAAACAATKLTLGSLGYGVACMGGHQDIKFECCGGTTTPPPPPMCTAEALTEMACIDDATWKTRADAACTAKKLTLTTLAFGTACMGGHHDIKFECCAGTTTPPPPPPPMCVDDALASMTCVDDATWKSRATAECTAKKLTLNTLAYGAVCMGGHLDIKFECCGGTTPTPPPTTMCTAEALTEMACIDDTTWKTRADAACTAKKLTLTTLAFGTACMGGHKDIKFECCAGTTTPPPPPPPPPPMCTTDKAVSPATCRAPDAWKLAGDAFCVAKHQKLSGLTLSGACTGGFSEAQFTCCPTTTVPPPATTCTTGDLGDGHTCTAETALKSQADAVCKLAGAALTAFAAYDTCAMTSSYLHAKYQCCK